MFYDVHLLTMNTSLVPFASLRSYSYETQSLLVRAAYLIHTVTQDILKFSQIFRISCEFQTISGGKRFSHSSNHRVWWWWGGGGCWAASGKLTQQVVLYVKIFNLRNAPIIRLSVKKIP